MSEDSSIWPDPSNAAGGVDPRRLIDQLFAGVLVVDPDETIRFVNRYVCDRIGLPPEQVVGRTLAELGVRRFREDGSEIVAGDYPIQRVLRAGEPIRGMVVEFRFPPDRSIWTLTDAFPEVDADGRIRHVVATFADITDLRRAEESLRDSEERLRVAADAADLGIWRHDLLTGIARVDERTREIFGLTALEAPFRTILERVHRWDLERLRAEMEAGMEPSAEGRRLSTEYRIVRPDGEVRWVSVHVRAHFEGAGPARRALFSIGTCQDVTDRKKTEEALFRTQKLEALGTLAGGVAHDFNNILLAIRGNAALALGDLPADHPARRYLAEIDRAGVRAAGVVKQILGFARPQPAEREVMSLVAPVEEALNLLRATISALVELDSSWGDGLPLVRVDAGQVQQAVVNLVKNAADAIGSRPGRVEIRLAERTIGTETGRIVAALDPGRYVTLTVSDDGPGMDKTTRERAFDPFFTTKDAGGGTGLGLSIVHGILHAHGGAATIESRPGGGTKVRLYFPAVEEGMAAPAAAPPASRERPRGERLLFVDDDDALVFLAREMLGRLGYRVTSFHDPVEALAAFQSSPDAFDGVISDVSMPRMSGFDLARQILALRPDLPVVITSGYVREEDEKAARTMGVRALLLKPNTVDEMAGELDRIFRQVT